MAEITQRVESSTAEADLLQDAADFLRQGVVVLVGHLLHRGLERQAGLDAHDQDVDDIG